MERTISVRVDETLYRRLALEKAHSGQLLQELVREALEEYLNVLEEERERAREI